MGPGDFLPYLYSRLNALQRTTHEALTDFPGLLARRAGEQQDAEKPLSGLLSSLPPVRQAALDQAQNLFGNGLMGMTVYHGSPHSFSAFDASKIGTGEGAQAYGHGLYFAENPKVAKTYGEKQYSVDLPDEHIANMVHWDRPMSEQPEAVKQALGFNDDMGFAAQNPEMTGRQAYNELALAMGRKQASDLLAKQGIPGIRYPDAGSRGQPTGTSNFVVFPAATDILRILGVQ